jgi:hypothetical protein
MCKFGTCVNSEPVYIRNLCKFAICLYSLYSEICMCKFGNMFVFAIFVVFAIFGNMYVEICM